MSSLVQQWFFHNACERTCPDSTLEHVKNVRATLLTLSFMKRRKKIATWTNQWHSPWWEGVLKTRVWAKEPLSSITNTIYTALTQPCKVRSKPLTQFHPWDLPSLGPQHAHTHTYMLHTRVSQRPDHPSRQDGKAGLSCRDAGENYRDCVKLAAGPEIWNAWFTRGNCSCSVGEQVAVSSLSQCWQGSAN